MKDIPVWWSLVVQLTKLVVQGGLDFIVNDSWVRCGKPFIYLVLSAKEICIWMLEVWPVNNEHRRPHFYFRGRHTFKIVNF